MGQLRNLVLLSIYQSAGLFPEIAYELGATIRDNCFRDKVIMYNNDNVFTQSISNNHEASAAIAFRQAYDNIFRDLLPSAIGYWERAQITLLAITSDPCLGIIVAVIDISRNVVGHPRSRTSTYNGPLFNGRESRKLDWRWAKYTVIKILFTLDKAEHPPGPHPNFHVDRLCFANSDPLPIQTRDDEQLNLLQVDG
ncbi:hypothetical protein GQ43DRAFT_488015 [Delitschia confertaspora ATCC 74209]|uniref:Uncharacterized protein n=1 Tax=Delitschia confertaspora ATCC 74209 TaxID=1513339 RepID=A0A9P4JL78_9PLEO|nr:hypothetical protein GQ43DRAFT_488015 [Delitschia confertaspora ATCC 74209]